MTVKLESLTLHQILRISKQYFYTGLAFLPIFWAVNSAWVGMYVKRRNGASPDEAITIARIRRFSIYYSLAGCLVWIVALTTWLAVYVIEIQNGSSVFDSISASIPKSLQ